MWILDNPNILEYGQGKNNERNKVKVVLIPNDGLSELLDVNNENHSFVAAPTLHHGPFLSLNMPLSYAKKEKKKKKKNLQMTPTNGEISCWEGFLQIFFFSFLLPWGSSNGPYLQCIVF